MSKKGRRVFYVYAFIELVENEASSKSEETTTKAATEETRQEQRSEQAMGDREQTTLTQFEPDKEPFKKVHEKTVQDKYAGYEQLVERNEAEGRQGTRERQEGA